MTAPDLSVVIPFYNEEGVAGQVVDEMADTLLSLGRTFELILIDDGSRDRTYDALCAAAGRWPQVRVLRQRPNAGQAAALWNGLQKARGGILITADGDGQNDPRDLKQMLGRLSGADMVVGVRANRQDSWLRRVMSRIANRVRRRWLGDTVSDTGCALKVFRREVLVSFMPIKTMYSFMPAFSVAGGFRVVEYPVHHRARTAGVSKYGLLVMLWRPFVDMMAIAWILHRRLPPVTIDETAAPDGHPR